MCEDKLQTLCDEHIMLFDQKTLLDGRKCGELARHINHSCDLNCYEEKWRAQ